MKPNLRSEQSNKRMPDVTRQTQRVISPLEIPMSRGIFAANFPYENSQLGLLNPHLYFSVAKL
jgi:hypothetical protein